jgi:hypothetical protein
MHFSFTTIILLTPGFSPVLDGHRQASRFNGFSTIPEAAEAADEAGDHSITGLKPGANERITGLEDFEKTP